MENSTTETIEDVEIKQPYRISKDNLSKKKSNQYNLIDNNNEETRFVLNNKWYEFQFDAPIYCQKISIKSNNKEISGLTLITSDPYNNETEATIKNKDSGHIAISANTVITGFKIKAPLRFLEKISLNSITITGYLEQDFEEIQSKVEKYLRITESIKSRSEALTSQKNDYDISVQEATKKLEQLNSQRAQSESDLFLFQSSIDSTKKENEIITTELAKSKTTLETTISNTESANNNLEQLRQKTKLLNEEITRSEKTLSSLINNKNLFAYEIEEYVKQGNTNIQSYTLLAFLPWLLIAYVAWYLFNGAADLTHIADSKSAFSIIDILISRLPFTAIAGAVIIVSYEISKIFIGKILEINTQKLRLSEIGIVAKDTSHASSAGLDLEDNEIYEVRTKLKMDLLKHHLKKLDPEKFEYDINPSIWDKYKKIIADRLTNTNNSNGVE